MSEYIYASNGEPLTNARGEIALARHEIVRCRDCKYYDESDAGCDYFVLAKNKLLHIGNPDGFCAWGERG